MVLRNLLGIKDPVVIEALERNRLLDLYQGIIGSGVPSRSLKMSDLMACQAGIGPLDYAAWDRQRDLYFAAIRAGAVLNLTPMKEQFREVLPWSTVDP
ncbi:hypothetical protein [Synechococcus sp. 1G10]|uniref:hypothetical protein n=1 Tax=Synechococcus sp. 1G10 TaxID=2025605 RepID=UPI0018E91111|nr:hypothetical protein [Synechococcus sp. 1G10]